MKNLIIVIAILMTACVPPSAYKENGHQMVTPFNEQDFARFYEKGTGSIVGQAFLKTRGGDVRFGAGDKVTLIPVTPYSQELWDASLKGDSISNLDYRYKKYPREIIADGTGNFEFTELPAGEYFLECAIFWEVPGYEGEMTKTGQVLKKKITVSEGQKLRVILTD